MTTRMRQITVLLVIVAASAMSINYIWSKPVDEHEEDTYHPQPTFIVSPEPWELSLKNRLDISHIDASAAILINENTGEIVASRNHDAPLPIASTTKILTAALALEFTEPQSVITIPPEAFDDLPPDSALMGIRAGDKYTVEELLYGLMLSSGNDAANALALAVSGTREEFVSLMNAKAQQLNLKNTHFTNPSGLDNPGHYSTAKELAMITHYARQFPLFKKIVASPSIILPYSANHPQLELVNLNPFISTYPGATGVKPGNTGEAGNCLVASVNRGGERYIGVLLNTPGRNTNMALLFDLVFQP